MDSTYRSTVNDVIVKTVAFADVSAIKPRATQNTSPKTYGYLLQIEYTSCGTPESKSKKSDMARLNK